VKGNRRDRHPYSSLAWEEASPSTSPSAPVTPQNFQNKENSISLFPNIGANKNLKFNCFVYIELMHICCDLAMMLSWVFTNVAKTLNQDTLIKEKQRN
jgi:hypothetical protein